MMDATWPGVTWPGVTGECHWLDDRVVLAKEYIYYIVKTTWHSPCGAHL